MRLIALLALLLLAACEVTTVSAPSRSAITPQAAVALQRFEDVAVRVVPVAEQECRVRRKGANCNFRILVDTDPRLGSNALQTLDQLGRPLIVVTLELLTDIRNDDELAFVIGHEAAHHIEGHIDEAEQRAVEGAVIGSAIAATLGLDATETEEFQRQGAFVGARRYSKRFELEADALGTIITFRSGYDPLKGAEFFNRIPDPGNRFLGTHPPNAERIATVRRVAASL